MKLKNILTEARGDNLLKQKHLSPSEYQIAKKQKGFEVKDFWWDAKKNLYTNNSIKEANADGTISKAEDKQRANLMKDFEKQLVVKWNKEYNQFVKNGMIIGGSFRGPGIKKELNDMLKDWASRMTR